MSIRERLWVEADDDGARLDRWLTESLQDLGYDVSRSQVQDWLAEGRVRADRTRLKASDRVQAGEGYEVDIPDPEPIVLAGEDIPLNVVHEDDDVVVIDKPRGLVVHPAAGHWQGTLVNALIGRGTRLSSLGGDFRPGVVHRIDKDTSGLLVLAKSDRAYHSLAAQLRAHSVQREYLAIAHGRLTHDRGLIDAPIGRDPKNRQRMAVTEGGKPAITHFEVVERFERYTYLRLRLETGRTHQIRVHLAYTGHPLAGDPVYGPRHTLPIEGQALHAHTLGFVHPATQIWLSFTSPLPADMAGLLSRLRDRVL
ncbi:RluA family pseudouridine synthase [Alicyclobacillus macrosporangiidus]|uniref:Pseudouridine synthase n=1 Tax=Alicyclobacillus macrosporangiidus TaxID=392015 RepID=A0A1I7H9P8_9BACL|nr:RluA family pseudouridine synthase [Alicyclobacillus macrosporangiidus]SFU57322.1 23S rRNA pseudouridine1911/1915/1917 synthase [Alicyclobacillus macrosporangiidus]